MNEWMMFLLTCDKKLTKSQLSPTHAPTKRKITDELKHNAGWYEVREGSPVEVQQLMSANFVYFDWLHMHSLCSWALQMLNDNDDNN